MFEFALESLNFDDILIVSGREFETIFVGIWQKTYIILAKIFQFQNLGHVKNLLRCNRQRTKGGLCQLQSSHPTILNKIYKYISQLYNEYILSNRNQNNCKKVSSVYARTFITPSHRFVFLSENGGLSEVNIFKGTMNSDCLSRTFWL